MNLREVEDFALEDLLKLYSPNRGFRVWKRINSQNDWCYKIVADCRSEDKDLDEYLNRKIEKFDVVNNKLEIMLTQIGEDEFLSEEEISEECRKMREA